MSESDFVVWLCCVFLAPTVTSKLISSPQPIIVKPGDDVILPCQLKPAVSADSDTIMWSKSGLEPKYVHYHQGGRRKNHKQHQSYYLRTRLFMDELLKGNISMKIFKVKTSDSGLYTCAVSSVKTDASVQLIVRESDVIGSNSPVRVKVGDDVILPCRLDPPLDMRNRVVEWKHKNHPVDQDQNFRGRTSLFEDEKTRGNISLKLSAVTEEDEGIYTCFVPDLQSLVKEADITLIVETKDPAPEPPDAPVVNITVALVFVAVGALTIISVSAILWNTRRKSGIWSPYGQSAARGRCGKCIMTDDKDYAAADVMTSPAEKDESIASAFCRPNNLLFSLKTHHTHPTTRLTLARL